MTMTGYHNIHVGPIAMRPVRDVNNGHTHIYIYKCICIICIYIYLSHYFYIIVVLLVCYHIYTHEDIIKLCIYDITLLRYMIMYV
jgi:hypothetical protein